MPENGRELTVTLPWIASIVLGSPRLGEGVPIEERDVTRRKPSGMTWRSWIDQQIHEAREDGAFDDLPGEGKPLDLTDANDPLWWVKSMLRRERLSVMPPALELRREVEKARGCFPRMRAEEDARRAVDQLNRKIGKLNRTATTGPPTSMGLLDADRIVDEWRRERAAAEESAEPDPATPNGLTPSAMSDCGGWLRRLRRRLSTR